LTANPLDANLGTGGFMKVQDLSVSLGTQTFEGLIDIAQLPERYRFMFPHDETLNVCGTYEVIQERDELPYVVIDSVIADNDAIYAAIDLSYIRTDKLAYQIEEQSDLRANYLSSLNDSEEYYTEEF